MVFTLGTAKQMVSVACLLICLAAAHALTDAEIAKFTSRARMSVNGVGSTQGTITVTKNPGTGKITIQTNNIPDHAVGSFPNSKNPNTIQTKTFQFEVQLNPAKTGRSDCLPMGTIGVAVNGVSLFSPATRERTNAGVCEEFDSCDGHPAPEGSYHYHKGIGCVVDASANDQFIGVALDGFPIYGPRKLDGTNVTEAELDDCHGREEGGNYRYHVTSTFPYFLGCYKGTVVDASTLASISRSCHKASDIEANPSSCSAVSLWSSLALVVLCLYTAIRLR